jgi:signal-transduction protein with cAMP-binding, CBS, and nucleotidyltransferase domain
MNSPVVSAEPDIPVSEIATKMFEAKVGSVVIFEDGHPAGIVTDGDIVFKVASKDIRPSDVRASHIMSTPLYTINSEKDISAAAREMRRLRVKRLGVVYKNELVGIVSVSDLVAATPELLDIISEKAKLMRGEESHKRSYVAGYCDSCNQWSDFLLEVDGKFTCDECSSSVTGQ